MKLNLHEECRVVFGFCKTLTSAAVNKTPVIDRRGYNGVEFFVNYGLTATKTDTFTLTVLESDSSATDAFTSVADANLNGTEALASRLAVTGQTSGTSINVAKRIGYKGNKRYVRAYITAVGSATMIGSCNALLFAPEAAATTNP